MRVNLALILAFLANVIYFIGGIVVVGIFIAALYNIIAVSVGYGLMMLGLTVLATFVVKALHALLLSISIGIMSRLDYD